jgi:hypothetical protein
MICYFSISILIYSTILNIQNNNAIFSSTNETLENNIVNITKKNMNNSIDNGNNTSENISKINKNRVSLGPDRDAMEGTVISIKGIISNAIAIPAQSVIYSWKQLAGPKIELEENEAQKSTLIFMAPNRPNDTKYTFELNAIQKSDNKNINLGKDSINILVVDTNKDAKGFAIDSTTIPKSSGDISSLQNPIE